MGSVVKTRTIILKLSAIGAIEIRGVEKLLIHLARFQRYIIAKLPNQLFLQYYLNVRKANWDNNY